MALPIAPVAVFALKYGSVALAAYGVARAVHKAPRDQGAEDALDRVAEGVGARREGEATHATARWRRVVRLGTAGPGVEIDAAGLGRIRLRRV